MNVSVKLHRNRIVLGIGAYLAIALVAAACLLIGCATPAQSSSSAGSASEQPAAEGYAVMRDPSFGGVYIDLTIDEFNALGFSYGDSVNVAFSNGYELKDIPYYNGYYVNVGDPLVVAYPGYPHVEVAVNYGDPLFDTAGLAEGDTATVTLAEAGKYLNTQQAFDISYSDERSDYSSDEQFANFRSLAGGSMTPNSWYRSASPVDNEYGRAAYANKLMEQAGVGYVLDLADNADEIAGFMAEDAEANVDVEYFKKLVEAGNVGAIDLSASYPSQSYKEKLAAGLVELSKHDGPYLVNCVEGKDRTGFVCILLESLAGASYDELLADYMKSFDNYYGINEQSDSAKFHAIVELNLHGALSYLAGTDNGADLRLIDYSARAANYLREGGMTDEQIDALVARL